MGVCEANSHTWLSMLTTLVSTPLKMRGQVGAPLLLLQFHHLSQAIGYSAPAFARALVLETSTNDDVPHGIFNSLSAWTNAYERGSQVQP